MYSTKMNRPAARWMFATAIITILPLVSACEPERGIRAKRDFPYDVDVACVEKALRNHFANVNRYDYVDDGFGSFPKGTQVAQFTYHRSTVGDGVSWVEVGDTARGARVAHSFTGIGMELPQEVFPEALAKIREANAALASECRLDIRSANLKEIGQRVEALHH